MWKDKEKGLVCQGNLGKLGHKLKSCIFAKVDDLISRKKAVGKVRAGHLADGRHTPCIFPLSPLHPPRRGNSRPPAPEEARATPAPDGSVMSLAAVRKWRASLPGCHAACNQGTGRAAWGVTARAFSAGVPPALQPVTSFALSIVPDFGCLWQPAMVHAPPARLRRSPG